MAKPIMTRAKSWARFIVATLRQSIRVGDSVFAINTWYRNPLIRFFSWSAKHDPHTKGALRACFKFKQGAFVDVGANIGQTLLKLLELDKERQYIGFEPQPRGAFLVDDFITKNECRNHVILPIGLSDTAGIVKLGVRQVRNDASASFAADYRPKDFYSAFKAVVTMRGDDVLEAIDSPIAVVKIDVEGAELEVMRGLVKTFSRHRPCILFEVLPHFLLARKQELDDVTKAARNKRHAEIQLLLRGLGYVFYQAGAEPKAVPVIKADAREKFDYIAVHSSDVDEFVRAMTQDVQVAAVAATA